MRRPGIALLVLLGGLGLVGCSAHRPVLYTQNPRYLEVGREGAERDIAECESLARRDGVSDRTSADGDQVARNATLGAVGGAAAGAVGGAIWGGAGTGAAAGAVSGLTWGILSSLFQAGTPNPVYMNYVNACLADRGYQPLGWQ